MSLFVLAGAALSPESASSRSPVANNVLRHALDVELGRTHARPGEMKISSGTVYALLDHAGALSRRAAQAGYRPARVEIAGSEGCQNQFVGNGETNTRVVQDCSLRSQAGEALAVNPLDESNMLVSQNDSRVGFDHCGFAWTLDGASHWGDQTPPFFQFELLSGHVPDACADPSITWDSQGNAYIAGHVFDVVDPASALVSPSRTPGFTARTSTRPMRASRFRSTRPCRWVSSPTTTTPTSRTRSLPSPRTRAPPARNATTSTSPGRGFSPNRRLMGRASSVLSSSASRPTVVRRGRSGSRSAARIPMSAPASASTIKVHKCSWRPTARSTSPSRTSMASRAPPPGSSS